MLALILCLGTVTLQAGPLSDRSPNVHMNILVGVTRWGAGWFVLT